MRYLYLLLLLSLAALLWAAFSIARHIRRHEESVKMIDTDKHTSEIAAQESKKKSIPGSQP